MRIISVFASNLPVKIESMDNLTLTRVKGLFIVSPNWIWIDWWGSFECWIGNHLNVSSVLILYMVKVFHVIMFPGNTGHMSAGPRDWPLIRGHWSDMGTWGRIRSGKVVMDVTGTLPCPDDHMDSGVLVVSIYDKRWRQRETDGGLYTNARVEPFFWDSVLQSF